MAEPPALNKPAPGGSSHPVWVYHSTDIYVGMDIKFIELQNSQLVANLINLLNVCFQKLEH